MRKKSFLFRGLAAVMGVLMLLSMSATTLVLGNKSTINSNLNISESVLVGGDEDSFTVYVENEYGYDSTALIEVYYDAADVNVEIAEEGITLLKNDDSALPLAEGSRITLFGNASVNSSIYSTTNPDYIPYVSYVSAMQAQFGEDNVNTVLCENVYEGMSSTGTSSVAEAVISEVTAYESTWQSDYNDAAIVVLARNGSEGNDVYQYASDDTYSDGSARRMMDLSTNEEALMSYLYEQKEAGVFDSIIVIIATEFEMELGFLEEYDVDACLLTGTTGSYGCTAVAEVLAGEVNPSGRTADTYSSSSVSSPAVVNAGVEGVSIWGNADELNEYDQINNDANIDYYVVYGEGIYVGYKYYETRYEDTVMGTGNASSTVGTFNSSSAWNYAEEMCYTFGYGLSYTTFEQTLDSVTFDESTNTYTVTVTVTNTGNVAGKDVVEVYAQTPYGDYEKENLVEKSAIQLINYAKTDTLEPGESQTLEISCMEYFLASYDTYGAETYILSAGDYYFAIGTDAHDALNNVLAAKGYTVADGMTADGDASKTYTWNQAELDAETYSISIYTDVEVTNTFDDADINYYDGYEYVYLTRSDWEGTWPEKVQWDATQEMMDVLSNYYYETPEDSPSVDDFTQGVDNGLTLVDMIGVDFDDELWDGFIDQLTVEQMSDTTKTSLAAVSELDIPSQGRGDDDTTAAGGSIYWVSHPLTARTWNTEMNTLRGKYEGLICYLNGNDEIWYGAANIHRTSYGGRVCQYWSEDATLDYWNGYYEAEAMQAVGVTMCVKHMAVNDQESQRTGLSVFVTEQALREIYLRAFEGSFAGGALGVMTTTGRVGPILGKNYSAMLTTVLKGEWGFKGHVTSDGYVNTGYYNNTLEEFDAGMDYSCLDSNGVNGARLVSAINDGDGHMLEVLREAAKRNLYVAAQSARMNGLGNGATMVAIAPTWEVALVVANIVIIVLFAACCILAIVESVKNRKRNVTVSPEKKGVV
ncbi:MAG: glycoside hydrolase family 3 C-terminal domain-containing protein [Lachnospiraceae bacterium]|nr:glycoside hydrolase family 3 C-terminal domain-containing protein [Lachnospiraceae bacterium]